MPNTGQTPQCTQRSRREYYEPALGLYTNVHNGSKTKAGIHDTS